MKKFLVMSALAFCTQAFSTLPTGQVPPAVVLSDKAGGLVTNGSAWDSATLKDQVSLIFYVAPKRKDDNKVASDTIKARNFNREILKSYAVINLGSPYWVPNFVLNNRIEASQKEYPHTTYVRDVKGELTKRWSLADDSSNVLLLDRNGNVIFSVDGVLTTEQTNQLMALIEAEIKTVEASRITAATPAAAPELQPSTTAK